ncbi:RNA-directed DNA polymerase, eukaryota [Tanacetum coccineum]
MCSWFYRSVCCDHGSVVVFLVAELVMALVVSLGTLPLIVPGLLEVGEDKDKCVWSLAHDGVFFVADLRHQIDDHIFPSLDTKTTWDKSLPRKVNIFMCRLKLDRLPHRLNLSSRGIEISEISCPSCSGNVKSNHHIFFSFEFAKEVWRIIQRWCDEAFPLFDSNAHGIDWLDLWPVSREKKHRLLWLLYGSFDGITIVPPLTLIP